MLDITHVQPGYTTFNFHRNEFSLIHFSDISQELVLMDEGNSTISRELIFNVNFWVFTGTLKSAKINNVEMTDKI